MANLLKHNASRVKRCSWSNYSTQEYLHTGRARGLVRIYKSTYVAKISTYEYMYVRDGGFLNMSRVSCLRLKMGAWLVMVLELAFAFGDVHGRQRIMTNLARDHSRSF